MISRGQLIRPMDHARRTKQVGVPASPGQFDDTIGPKLNRRVRVIEEHSATGIELPTALDIEPHEPGEFESA